MKKLNRLPREQASPDGERTTTDDGLDVAWKNGGRIVATGNSFAAPHIAGFAARIRSAHPAVTPFEIKTLLAATATRPD